MLSITIMNSTYFGRISIIISTMYLRKSQHSPKKIDTKKYLSNRHSKNQLYKTTRKTRPKLRRLTEKRTAAMKIKLALMREKKKRNKLATKNAMIQKAIFPKKVMRIQEKGIRVKTKIPDIIEKIILVINLIVMKRGRNVVVLIVGVVNRKKRVYVEKITRKDVLKKD